MLKAAEIELPKSLLVHGWWLKSGEKMSKSTGTVVDPLDLIEQFGSDAFRYFVTREMNVGQDSEFSLDRYMVRYNSDLANDLGNLLSRVLTMLARGFEGVIPAPQLEETLEQELWKGWDETHAKVLELFEEFQFHTGLERIFAFVSSINRYAEQRAPWKLAKSEDPLDKQRLDTTLFAMSESVRLAVGLLEPVMPETTEKVYSLIGYTPDSEWKARLVRNEKLAGSTVGAKTILFPKPPVEA
jgi:methionyl-tRNA synthetase